MGKSNTVVSAYTMYRHLQQYCSHPSIEIQFIKNVFAYEHYINGVHILSRTVKVTSVRIHQTLLRVFLVLFSDLFYIRNISNHLRFSQSEALFLNLQNCGKETNNVLEDVAISTVLGKDV